MAELGRCRQYPSARFPPAYRHRIAAPSHGAAMSRARRVERVSGRPRGQDCSAVQIAKPNKREPSLPPSGERRAIGPSLLRTSNRSLSKWMNSTPRQTSSSESGIRCTPRRTYCIPTGIHRSLRETDCTPSETRCSPDETRCSPSGTDCIRSGTGSHQTPTGFTASGTHSTWRGTHRLQSAISSPHREVSRAAGRSAC